MVAPDAQFFDVGDGFAGFFGNLAGGAVVVEAQHGGEVFCGQVGGGLHGDVGVGVGGIADDQHFHIAVGHFVQGCALHGENLRVGLQEVGAFHAFAARARADEDGNLRVFKGNFGIVGGGHAGQERESAVLQFHHHAFDGVLRLRQVEKLQNHGLVFAEHFAGCDAEKQGIADLAGCAGYGNTDGGFHINAPLRRLVGGGKGLMPLRGEGVYLNGRD